MESDHEELGSTCKLQDTHAHGSRVLVVEQSGRELGPISMSRLQPNPIFGFNICTYFGTSLV